MRLSNLLPWICLVLPCCSAESLVLQDGRTIQGKVIGLNAQEVVVARCGRVEHYPKKSLASIELASSGPETSCEASALAIPELPAGSSIDVRVLDFVNSAREQPGQTFRGVVAAPFLLNDKVLFSSGSKVVLRLVQQPNPLGASGFSLEIAGIQIDRTWGTFSDPAKETSPLWSMQTNSGSPLDTAWKSVVPAETVVVKPNEVARFSLKRKASVVVQSR